MNGYPTDFGITECIKLCASKEFSDKRVAYLGMMILVDETEQVLMLMTNSLKQDLNSPDVAIIALALNVLGDIGSAEMMRELIPDIETHMQSPNPHIRKKAGLAAVRAVRKLNEEETVSLLEFTSSYFDIRSSAVHVSGAALITALCAQHPDNVAILRASVLQTLLSILHDHATGGPPRRKSDLYGSAHDAGNAFLICKLVGAVRLLIADECHPDVQKDVAALLTALTSNCDDSKIRACSILYECARTCEYVHDDVELRTLSLNILGRFLQHKEATVRYIGFKELTRFADVHGAQQLHTLSDLHGKLLTGLNEPDTTVSKQAVDVIFRTTNASTVEEMVAKLCEYVKRSDDGDTIRDACEKIVLLAEKFGSSEEWKVDMFITALTLGHEVVTDDLLTCFVAMVSKKQHLRSHAVTRIFSEIIQPFAQRRSEVEVTDFLGDEVNAAAPAPLEKGREGEIERRPRVEAVALYVVGEYADLALSNGIEASVLIDAFDNIIEMSDDPEDSTLSVVGDVGVTGLVKIAARLNGDVSTIPSIGGSASGVSAGATGLGLGLGGLEDLVGDVIEPSGSTQLVVSNAASGNNMQMVGYDPDLSALDGLASIGVEGGNMQVATFKGGQEGSEVVIRIQERLQKLSHKCRNLERQQRSCEYAKLLENGFLKSLANAMGRRPEMNFSSVADVINNKHIGEGRRSRPFSGTASGGLDGSLLLDLSDDVAATGGDADNSGSAARDLDAVLAITAGDDEYGGDGGSSSMQQGDGGGTLMGLDLLALTDVPESTETQPQGQGQVTMAMGTPLDTQPMHQLEEVMQVPVQPQTPEVIDEPPPMESPPPMPSMLLEAEEVTMTASFISVEEDEDGQQSGCKTKWMIEMMNISAGTLSECALQLAVPKYMQLNMDMASSSEMAVGESIKQAVHLNNDAHGTKPIQLRFRVEWLVGEGEADETSKARHEGVTKLEIP